MKKSSIFKAILIFSLVMTSIFCASAEESTKKVFKFKYHKGDKFGLVSRVEEDVKINGRRMPHMTILNRVSMTIDDIDEKGRGHYNSVFRTTESFSEYGMPRSVDWDSYVTESNYWRDRNGIFDIADTYFMPIIRDLPVFPEEAIGIGDEWTKEGYEAEDFRKSFKIHKPFKVPFKANYKYVRDEEYTRSDGETRNLQVIQAKYNLMFEAPATNDYSILMQDPPVVTMGISNRTIWWDNERGQIDHSVEDFRITIETYSGTMYVFTGRTTSEMTEFVTSATDDNVKIVQGEVEKLGLDNISVSKSDKGLKIAIENVQFEPDSAVLVYKEQKKLRELAKILKKFPNDILISGHTASVDDDEESCQILSEQRAESVANFLIKIWVRTKDHIFTEGFGSKRPVGDNSTEEGRKKNRRVEITILDK